MELSEFVQQSLEQIVKGVKDAQEAVSKDGGIVNPAVDSTTAGVAATFGHTENGIPALLVHFDVAVTVSASSGGSGGGKLSVAGLFNVGGEASLARSNESTSRIQFPVPLALPIDRKTQAEKESKRAEIQHRIRNYSQQGG